MRLEGARMSFCSLSRRRRAQLIGAQSWQQVQGAEGEHERRLLSHATWRWSLPKLPEGRERGLRTRLRRARSHVS